MTRAVVGGAIVASLSTTSAHASGLLPNSLEVKLDTELVCKSVLVVAGTSPTVTVTIAKKPYTVNVSEFVTAEIKVCVRAAADAVVVINANADLTNPLCPIVTGNISTSDNANAFVSVKVSGLGKDGLEKTVDSGDLVGPLSGDIPLLVVVCDP